MDRMVAPEIQDNKSRHGLLGRVGKINQNVHTRPACFAGKVHRYLLTSGRSAQGLAVQVENLECHLPRPPNRRPSINIFAEKLENLRPAPRTPHLGIGNLRPVCHNKRLRQSIIRHLLLVVDKLLPSLAGFVGQFAPGLPAFLPLYLRSLSPSRNKKQNRNQQTGQSNG